MFQWRSHPVLLILFLGAASWLTICVYAQEPHRFGEAVALGSDASLVVVKRDVGEFRSRYPSEFPSTDHNLVAFEFRYGKSGIYHFKTDRNDPSRSDVVAVCGTERVNILKIGSGTFADPKAYSFGRPGAYQAKDGRWGSIAAGGAMPLVIFFSLPAGCAPEQARLLVTVDVGRAEKEEWHQLVFTEDSSKP
jgi:hypothetical protein